MTVEMHIHYKEPLIFDTIENIKLIVIKPNTIASTTLGFLELIL
jgi:hypothetical protein